MGGSTLPGGLAAHGVSTGATRNALSIDAAQNSGIAIDAGGPSVSSGWVADTDYSGGGVSSSTATVDTSRATNAAPEAVYDTQRYGTSFSYVVGGLTPNTAYTVRLHFAETYFTAAGKRVFNAAINGATVLSKFDVYKAAGGGNIALVESFTSNADATGTIAINFSAVVNYPSVAGVQIASSSSGSGSSGTSYPIYSTAFTGNTPFHHTVAQLMAAGATVRSSTIAKNLWRQGFDKLTPASETGGPGPTYTVHSGDAGYKFGCPAYGSCNANGLVVHYPSGAAPETGSDHHIISFDPVYIKGEVDGWGGDGKSSEACKLESGNPGKQTCSWGGYYPFSGNGLAGGYSSGNAGGYAVGLIDITAQELLQGHIDHALGIDQSCVDDGGVYPSIVGRPSDKHCSSSLEPTVRFGDMVHLKSSVNVSSLGYSKYCTVIVQALQTYGAYTTMTNGGWGLALQMEYMNEYQGTNPWFQTIFPSLAAGGDGSGSNQSFSFDSCLSRIPADDIEVIQISSHLPPA